MKKHDKRYIVIACLFVAVLLISNIVSTKITSFWGFTFDAGTLLFPLSYIFGDILVEIYGYKASRKVIWLGFLSALLMSGVIILVGYLPSAGDRPYQEAYMKILWFTPRIVLASLIAFFVGEFSNAYIMAKMKIWSKWQRLRQRTIGSTIIGEFWDTFLFVFIAFFGVMPMSVLRAILLSNYIFKVGIEVLFTPLTYKIVWFLKRKEDIDSYDTDTNFSPFKF